METKRMDSEIIIGGLTADSPTTKLRAARALVAKAAQGITRVLSGCLFEGATEANTVSAYRCKHSAGQWLSDGVVVGESAVDPRTLGDNFDAYTLHGADFVPPTSPGVSVAVAFVAYIADGVGKVCAICSAAAAAAPRAPTLAQIRAALKLVHGADWDGWNGLVLGRAVYSRNRADAIKVDGVIAENDVFTLTCNGIEVSVTADADDIDADVAEKLRAAATTLLADEPVTIAGATDTVLITADTGATYTLTVAKTSVAGTIVATNGDTVTGVFTDPSTNAAHAAERAAGSLFSE